MVLVRFARTFRMGHTMLIVRLRQHFRERQMEWAR